MISKRESNAIKAKEDLLNAVGLALKKHGFAKLGVNTIAQEAKTDKTAIYRYFNNIEELLEAYVFSKEYWLKSLQNFKIEDTDNLNELTKAFINEQVNSLLKNEEFCQLIMWELGDRQNISSSLTVKREIYSENILKQSRDILKDCGIDFNFILAIILGGGYYLAMRKDKYPFCEVELARKEHRQKFIETLDWLIDLLFKEKEQVNQVEKIALRLLGKGLDKSEIAEITEISINRLDEIIG